MTLFGHHVVNETRDYIRATEFRVNQNLKLFEKIRPLRKQPQSSAQNLLDKDLATFVRRWTDVRDKVTNALELLVHINPFVSLDLLPCENQYLAIDNAVRRDDPRFITIQQRIDVEAVSLGLPPLDLSATPAFDSPDADFNALKKLDKTIDDMGNPLGKPGGSDSVLTSPIGLTVIGVVAVGGLLGAGYIKNTFFPSRR